eukprot:scaffold788_cov163-Alexandrium_tamarense.AAC.2
MSAADDQNAAITTPERRNNSGILPSDAGRPAGWVGGLLSVHWSQTTPPPPPWPWLQPSSPPLPRPPLLSL